VWWLGRGRLARCFGPTVSKQPVHTSCKAFFKPFLFTVLHRLPCFKKHQGRYRLYCGLQEQTDEQQQQQTDEQQQTEHVGFLFRPRDALELLRTSPLWKADKVASLDDKVGHNSQAHVAAG
jgi:hypothetical protein